MPRPKDGQSHKPKDTIASFLEKLKVELGSVKGTLPSLFAEERYEGLEGILDLVLNVLLDHGELIAKYDNFLTVLNTRLLGQQKYINFFREEVLKQSRPLEEKAAAAETAAVANRPVEEELTLAEKVAEREKARKSELLQSEPLEDKAAAETVAAANQPVEAVIEAVKVEQARKSELSQSVEEKVAAETVAAANQPVEKQLALSGRGRTSRKAQLSRGELQRNAPTERAAAEETANQATNEQAFTDIDVEGRHHVIQARVASETTASEAVKVEQAWKSELLQSEPLEEKAAAPETVAAANQPVEEELDLCDFLSLLPATSEAAAEKNLAKEQAVKFPAEKAAVANDLAEEELLFTEKVADMSASPKAQWSKRELQPKPTLKSAAERAAAEERANQAANEQAFTKIDSEGHYQLLQGRVVFRKGPSTDAGHTGFGKRDVEFIGTPNQERMTRAQIDKLVAESKPSIPDQQRESGRLWVVVGGVGKGGIIVRRECDFKSTALDTKLATGTLIEELEIQGNRLHYKRIRGDGPDFGWVTMEQNGKHLVEIYSEAAEVP